MGFRENNQNNHESSDLVGSKKFIFKHRGARIIFVIIFFIIMLLSFFGIYHIPRTISSYIKEDISNLKKVEIKDNDIYSTSKKIEDKNVIEDILNIKVTPIIFKNKKRICSYEITFYYEKNIYVIKDDSIKSNEKIHFFNDDNYTLYSTIREYIGS